MSEVEADLARTRQLSEHLERELGFKKAALRNCREAHLASEARVTQLETALTEAMQSLATGPLKEGYAYGVLARAVDSKP